MTAIAPPSTLPAGRTRRSAWNYFSGLLLTATNMLVGLYATPRLLGWLGDERYGAFRAMTDWGGYLVLLDFGAGGAMLAVLARNLGQNDDAAVRRTMLAGFRGYLRIAATMLLIGAVLAVAMPHLVVVSASARPDLVRAFVLSLLGIILVPLAPFRWFAEASQRGYVVSGLLTVQSLVITAVSLWLAYRGAGITGQAVGVLVGALFLQVALAGYGLRRCPGLLHAGAAQQTHVERRELLRLSRPIFILHACVMIGLLSDNIIIGRVLGAAMVAPFFVTQRLISIAAGQVRAISNASWAALAELHVTGQHETFTARVLELTSLVIVIGAAALVPIVAFNRAFIRLWVGEATYAGETVTILAAVNGLLGSVLAMWIWLFDGAGQAARLVPMAVIAATINILASIVCTKLIGLPGPLIGTAIALAGVQLAWLPALVRKAFGIPARSVLWALAAPLAVAVPYAAICGWWSYHFAPQTWLGLALAMAGAASLFLILAWVTLLSADQKSLWLLRARLALRGPKAAGR